MAKKKLYKRFTKRQWLNRSNLEGNGFIAIDIEEIDDDDYKGAVHATVDIADCTRRISLNFTNDSYPSAIRNEENSLRKLNIIINALNEFRDEFTKAVDIHKEKVIRIKANKKNKKKKKSKRK